MDLFLAICQGLGLALAIGIGGAIAALFAAAMASLETGIDPRGTDYSFIAETWFLGLLFAAVVLGILARTRAALRYPLVAVLAAAGAIAFAASLAEEGETAWPGLIVGALAALAAALVSLQILEGAIRRAAGSSDGDGKNAATEILVLIFALAGIVTAAAALFVPPLSLLAAVALAVLAAGRRRKAGEKYEGLRILK